MTNRIAWLAVLVPTLCVITSGTRSIARTTDPPGAKSIYLVVYRPGPAWISGKAVSEQPLKEHGRYMLSLYVKGRLKLAGPFLDDAGGALAFEAANREEAEAVVAADPAVVSKVFVAELHPWRLVEWEQYVKKP